MFHPDAARRVQRTPGQLRTRVEELKNPWRQGSPLTLSHNESARLATDALLEQGEEGYLRALADEKELPFLSTLDIEFVRHFANVSSQTTPQPTPSVEGPEEDGLSEQTSGTYFPMMSDIDVPMLELGWPEIPPITKHSQTEVTVHFQRDRSNSIKDLIRSLISKAKTVIAIVMDLFTDVDIICDLVGAASKRKVPVYLLLDEKNLGYFIEMWEKLDFKSIQVPNLKVRTVTGSTYCTKSGKKFSGQFLEKFILIDCEQVIAGTFSFSWIASQVHSNMVTLFIGKIVEDFDTEFRCLYAVSNTVDYFSNVDSKISPYSRPSIWNTQPLLRFVPELTPSNGSSSHSNSTVSSLKASPYVTSTSYKLVNEDKHALPDFSDHGRREVNGGFRMNIINQHRRLSNPNNDTLADRDHSFGLHKLGLRTSLLSKSTPALNQLEPVPNFALGTITESNFSQTEYKTGSKNANFDRVGQEENSKDQSNKMSRNDKRMTLGHSHLDMMMNYRRPNAGTNGQQTENKPCTTVKSNVSRFQADIANLTHLVGRKDVSKEKNSTLNGDEKTMTLGHSKLDMITNFRPQLTNNLPVENLASTNVKSDSSLNQSTNSNYMENKMDECTNSTGLKANLVSNQSTLNSDEKTMTLGHSRLDMITKCRPQPTTGSAGLQPGYKTSPMLKSDVSSNHITDVSRTEGVRDTCTNHVGQKDGFKESNNLSRSDKRMTLGHSKLDMITNHNKGKPTQVYSRFRP